MKNWCRGPIGNYSGGECIFNCDYFWCPRETADVGLNRWIPGSGSYLYQLNILVYILLIEFIIGIIFWFEFGCEYESKTSGHISGRSSIQSISSIENENENRKINKLIKCNIIRAFDQTNVGLVINCDS